MSGFSFAWRKGGRSTPLCIEALIGKSTQIHAGDVLVYTVASTYTGAGASQYPVVRPLLSGDSVTTSNGILGVAMFDVQTDANANIQSVASPVTVDTRGKLDTTMPYSNDLAKDPVSGYVRIFIMAWDPQNVFKGKTQTNDVANFYDVGRVAQIVASAASAPANYTINTNNPATANSPMVVEGVDSEDPQFNSANGGGALFVAPLYNFYARNIANGFFAT